MLLGGHVFCSFCLFSPLLFFHRLGDFYTWYGFRVSFGLCSFYFGGGSCECFLWAMAPADMMRTDAGRMSWYPSRHGGCWFRKMSCMPPGGFAVWVISSVASLSRVCFVLLV